MQINIDGAQMYQELAMAYQICCQHKGCEGCPCYNGQPFSIGQSQIICENFGKNKKDA